MFNSGFDFMFNLMPVFMTVFFIVFLFFVIRGIKEWHSNNQQPIIPIQAKVISKRQRTDSHMDANNIVSSSTDYYITFGFTNGERTEVKVSGREYGKLAENDTGILSMQGTRYIGFERK